MNITKKFINYNTSYRPNRQIEYIVIHDTGNPSLGANAEMHYRYFNEGNKNASADFFVDSNQIIQTVDYRNNNSWHCGDGGGKYGITNANSIGIEMCINSDGNFISTLTSTIELTYLLMKELNLGIDRVVRHYDASRKNCPARLNYNNWECWLVFKARLLEKIKNDSIKDKVITVSDLRKELGILDASWAKGEVEKALKSGIINTSHDPNEPVTFGVMITLINRLYEKLSK